MGNICLKTPPVYFLKVIRFGFFGLYLAYYPHKLAYCVIYQNSTWSDISDAIVVPGIRYRQEGPRT